MFGWRVQEDAKIRFTITVNWQLEDSSITTKQLGTVDRGACRSTEDVGFQLIEACRGSNSQKEQKPLRTADIYNALVAQRYPFTFEEPKKILGIRLYKMLGVQPLGGNLFKAK